MAVSVQSYYYESSSLLSVPAVIQAGRSSNLAFQVSGVVTSIQVNESIEVEKGDVLATLDPRTTKFKLMSPKHSLIKVNQNLRERRRFSKRILSHSLSMKP